MNHRAVTLILLVMVAPLVFWHCGSTKKEERPADRTAPLTITGATGAFNESFAQLLDTYYSLKEAFVEEDSTKVNAAAKTLQLNSGSLKVEELQGDSTGMIKETAKQFAETIAGSSVALAAEQDMEAKRREFNMITDAMWSLTRTVRYNGSKVYYQYCPMAFDNAGAYWLSNSRQVRNPYFGSKMLSCGEVADSLDYSK